MLIPEDLNLNGNKLKFAKIDDTSTIAAASITDLAQTVKAYSLSDFAQPVANINFVFFQALRLAAWNLTTTARVANGTAMGATYKGVLCFDTTLNKFFIWSGTAWLPATLDFVAGSGLTISTTNGTVTIGVDTATLLNNLGLASLYQPLDSDLTAIAAINTTAFGRSLLAVADLATLKSNLGVGVTSTTFLEQIATDGSYSLVSTYADTEHTATHIHAENIVSGVQSKTADVFAYAGSPNSASGDNHSKAEMQAICGSKSAIMTCRSDATSSYARIIGDSLQVQINGRSADYVLTCTDTVSGATQFKSLASAATAILNGSLLTATFGVTATEAFYDDISGNFDTIEFIVPQYKECHLILNIKGSQTVNVQGLTGLHSNYDFSPLQFNVGYYKLTVTQVGTVASLVVEELIF